MTEEKAKTLEELLKGLEGEREKTRRLEELIKRDEAEIARKEGLLNELYRRIMIEGMTNRDEISSAIGKEQYDSLTYHLSKEHEERVKTEKKLLEDEEKLKVQDIKIAEESEFIERDKKRISELENELAAERKKRMEIEKNFARGYKPKAGEFESGFDELLEDIDLVDIDVAQERAHSQRASRRDVTVKDLTRLLLRINRMRAIDASIMLNTSKEKILLLASMLAKKGYLEIENPKGNDPTLRALKRLLDLKRH
ncbi:MAG: hypothetical protein V1703_03730 [Candidatus Altiarchaeota archaeon]